MADNTSTLIEMLMKASEGGLRATLLEVVQKNPQVSDAGISKLLAAATQLQVKCDDLAYDIMYLMVDPSQPSLAHTHPSNLESTS